MKSFPFSPLGVMWNRLVDASMRAVLSAWARCARIVPATASSKDARCVSSRVIHRPPNFQNMLAANAFSSSVFPTCVGVVL